MYHIKVYGHFKLRKDQLFLLKYQKTSKKIKGIIPEINGNLVHYVLEKLPLNIQL